MEKVPLGEATPNGKSHEKFPLFLSPSLTSLNLIRCFQLESLFGKRIHVDKFDGHNQCCRILPVCRYVFHYIALLAQVVSTVFSSTSLFIGPSLC